jgi:hypothetical protein
MIVAASNIGYTFLLSKPCQEKGGDFLEIYPLRGSERMRQGAGKHGFSRKYYPTLTAHLKV